MSTTGQHLEAAGGAAPGEERWFYTGAHDDWTRAVGPFSDRGSAVEAGSRDREIIIAGGRFFTGRRADFAPTIGVQALNDLIEDLSERSYAYAGEFAEGWLDDLADSEVDDLGRRIDAAIQGWLFVHGRLPQFCLMEEVIDHVCRASGERGGAV